MTVILISLLIVWPASLIVWPSSHFPIHVLLFIIACTLLT